MCHLQADKIYRFQVYNYIIIYKTFDHHKESV